MAGRLQSSTDKDRFYPTSPTMPRQAILSSQKTTKWAEDTIDAIDAKGTINLLDGRNTKTVKQTNYNLANGVFDPDDLKYVVDPYGLGEDIGKQPARLRNFNLLINKLNLLKGDELETPFEWTVIGLAGEVVNAVKQERDKTLKTAMLNVVRQELIKLTNESNDIVAEDPSKVVKEFDRSYRDPRERNANRIIKIMWEDLMLKEKFSEGWDHALKAAEEFYYVALVRGKPYVRVVNPLYFDFDRTPEIPTVQNSDWAKEERYLSPGQIIDEFGAELTSQQIKEIEDGNVGSGVTQNYFYPEFAYEPVDLKINLKKYGDTTRRNKSNYIRVVTCVWKSKKKIGFVRQINDEGQIEEILVDDTFKLSDEQKDAGVEIHWEWISEVWQGEKIGSKYYVNIGPLPYQMRSRDNMSECKLPYVGRVYNGNNAIATSIVDIIKPHQYMYNIVWYKLEHELSKAKGKAIIMDLAKMPKSEGMDTEEWIYYLTNAGILFINSAELDDQGNPKGTDVPLSSVDLTLSQSINQYLGVLNKIEDLVDQVSGIPAQRQAQVSPSETATGVERSISQSSTITAPYFFIHDQIKRDVLTHLIEICKIAYEDGTKGMYYTDDAYRVMLNIDGDLFNDSDYGVFVTNAANHRNTLKDLNRVGAEAVKANNMLLSQYMHLLESNSLSDKKYLIEEGEAEAQRNRIAVEEAKNQAIIQQATIQQQTEREKQDREDARMRLKSETDIRISQIQALTKLGIIDADSNKIPDILEIQKFSLEKEKLGLEREKETNKNKLEEKKIELERIKSENELKIAKENKNRFDK